ncbi:hypothetical protein CCP3SC15_6730001 [Gammaproteobacteria bacterium]
MLNNANQGSTASALTDLAKLETNETNPRFTTPDPNRMLPANAQQRRAKV